ncbi:Uncharacterized protein family UPF0538 [Carpediemonas membranifera]|uniref:Uncharacterized protein family UPF0538 n=1 Tax=Carpediemonas membranifera TaxID=201153 RepID=A0A8J6DZQ4_9EUKA|nr:Uncharacterized protein family UPF0538 [Carpediemonas membranifera]|eukprot:KAG9393969.1 Uncharacterized protein family UPF0538 [Carpediemonas membranifera]
MENENGRKIILTIRLIRSLAHRNIRLLVLRQVPQDITVSALFDLIFATISLDPKFKIFAAMKPKADTLKIYSRPQSHKTQNLAINIGDDEELVLDSSKKLSDYKIGSETELSLFLWSEYEEFCRNPDAQRASFGH